MIFFKFSYHLCGFIIVTALSYSGLVLADIVPAQQAGELKNRFRIDHLVDSMTLIVQRQFGSGAVIIVLPDGSKLFSKRHPDNVVWIDGLSGDIITINDPLPGPWQLIGHVVEGSIIKKVSELGIWVEELPQPLYQGERLKVTAHLLADKQRLRMPGLDYLFNWTAKFTSGHQAGDENFTAGTRVVGTYKDNGEGLDERPDDGVFTSTITLNHPWGQYHLSVKADNDVFEREVTYPFVLSPMPIDIAVIEPDDPLHEPWTLLIQAKLDHVVLNETYLDLELVGPAGLQLPLVIRGLSEAETELTLPKVTDFGSYRIKGTAVSTLVSGREVVLTLPEHFFNLIEPPVPPPSAEELAAVAAKKAAIEEKKAKEQAVFWIITVNISLLFFGSLALLIWRKYSNLKEALAATQLRLEREKLAQEDTSVELDEIDLTMPEDE
ncbi:TIGR03503 family protein [Shewanella sp. VB17]|uniref:TIGR03503 family protein n=1 Tax=Shewanella sp. VB17 TaxID=2739432 RepID=UPI001565FBE3|nr:TIGR03503 family protein [Shewanella sp. VB17]NRD74272.1 TIGR03503 family protein [Shewanella sp. VB17]